MFNRRTFPATAGATLIAAPARDPRWHLVLVWSRGHASSEQDTGHVLYERSRRSEDPRCINLEMIVPQNRPASVLQLLIAADAVGISSVNIPTPPPTSPPPYCDFDSKAIALARQAGATNISSVETTHGVIRSMWPDAPFIYATAIPNRVCHFPDEASGLYAQEFPSSHNAGIALKYVIPHFVSAITP